MKLGIVSGLRSEQVVLSGIEAQFYVSGASAARAFEGSKELVDKGVEALVSFGVSGGLSEGLDPGTLLLPDTVIGPDGACFQTAEVAGRGVTDPAFGSDVLVTSSEAKRELHNLWGAASVDMESHAVGRAAQDAHLPFFAIRTIADTVDQILPPAAGGAVAEDGSINTLRTLMGLLARPQDLPALIALGRQSATAHETLRSEGRRLIEALTER
ncbi:MAG: hypothetical protein AAF830_14170 [Pseudomonadota bacterium]